MTRFELLKTVEMPEDSLLEIMFDVLKKVETTDEMKSYLDQKVPPEVLEEINRAALREGRQPVSLSGLQ